MSPSTLRLLIGIILLIVIVWLVLALADGDDDAIENGAQIAAVLRG